MTHDDILQVASDSEQAGNARAAEASYRQCIQQHPEFTPGWLFLAAFLNRQNRWEEGIQAAQHALTDQDSTVVAAAHSIIGRCQNGLDRPNEAEKSFRASLALRSLVTTWVFLGVTLAELERDDEAIECHQSALRIDPACEEAHYNLGNCYARKKRIGVAIKHYRRALEIDPEYAIAYAELGHVLMKPRTKYTSLSEAKEALLKSIQFDPEYGWSRIYLGYVLEWNDDPEGAAEQYREAARIWPDSSLAHAFLGGVLADGLKDIKGARIHFKRAIAIDSTNRDAQYNFGRVLANFDRPREGVKYLKIAATLGHAKAKSLLEQIQPRCLQCGMPWTLSDKGLCECGNKGIVKRRRPKCDR